MNEKDNRGRILVVDDLQENIQVLGGVLRREGYQINVARNGQHALEIVDAMPPDLILLDIMMPKLDGRETCKRLKSSPATKDIPVIFLTARTEVEEIVQGFELGAVDYVTKPFNLPELMSRVNTHIELKLNRDIVAMQNDERKELLHVLCHDITNPLSVIKVYLQLSELKPDTLQEKRLDMLCAVDNGLQVIDLVREIHALDEGKIELELETVNLKFAVNSSYSILEPRLAEKQVILDIQIDNYLAVQAEKTSFINSVLNNLLTNAIKFSFPESRVAVEAHQENNQVVLTVTDSGIGMSETLVDEIFETGKATSRNGTNGERGTGFGMPLMKKFVTAYGGRIELSSKEKSLSSSDHGTEVKLILLAE